MKMQTARLLCTVLVATVGLNAEADDNDTVRAILADWESRLDSIKRIQIVAPGSATILKGAVPAEATEIGKALPEEDHTFEVRSALFIDFKKIEFERKAEGIS